MAKSLFHFIAAPFAWDAMDRLRDTPQSLPWAQVGRDQPLGERAYRRARRSPEIPCGAALGRWLGSYTEAIGPPVERRS